MLTLPTRRRSLQASLGSCVAFWRPKGKAQFAHQAVDQSNLALTLDGHTYHPPMSLGQVFYSNCYRKKSAVSSQKIYFGTLASFASIMIDVSNILCIGPLGRYSG